MSRTDQAVEFRAWLAGIVDGEGSLGVYNHKDNYKNKKYLYYRPNITIGMTDMWVIKKIQKTLGFGTLVKRKVLNTRRMRREVLIYSIQNWDDAYKFTEIVLPYLTVKKSIAFIVNFASTQRDNKDKMKYFSELTKKLNQRSYIWQKILN